MNLYELTQEQLELNMLLEESMGELTPELEEALKINKEDLEAKAEGYCKAIAMYERDAKAFKEESDRLLAKKKTAEAAIKRMKDSLLATMGILKLDKVEAGTFKIGKRKSYSVEILDEDVLPESYVKVSITKSPDKNAIKDAINEGEEVSGARIVESSYITIK